LALRFDGARCFLIGLLSGHRLRPLDPHRACRDATPPQARRSGPGGAATQEEAVDTDSNACRAGEVERKVWRDNDSLLRGQLLKTLRLEARAVARWSVLALGQLRSKAALTTFVPLRIVMLRSRLVGAV